jgi:FAD/FMN-containing dehydrogenase
VLYAIKNNFRIRSSGYRHSWGPIFGQTNEILVSFVDLKTVTTTPDPITIAEEDTSAQSLSELGTIEIMPDISAEGKLVRLGAAVTGEDFRRWQLANGWAMPVNTILVEVTMGGIVSGLCHGAGIKHKAIPDYVHSIEYVDCKGELQIVHGARFLTVAAGNYGLVSTLPWSSDILRAQNELFYSLV